MGVAEKPNVELAEASGLDLADQGIAVNAACKARIRKSTRWATSQLMIIPATRAGLGRALGSSQGSRSARRREPHGRRGRRTSCSPRSSFPTSTTSAANTAVSADPEHRRAGRPSTEPRRASSPRSGYDGGVVVTMNVNQLGRRRRPPGPGRHPRPALEGEGARPPHLGKKELYMSASLANRSRSQRPAASPPRP